MASYPTNIPSMQLPGEMVFSSTASNWAAASLFILNMLVLKSDLKLECVLNLLETRIFEVEHALAKCRCQLIKAVKEPIIITSLCHQNSTKQ